ncbi:MAG: hypothetical protein BWY72_00028 [Bacteroidetes bacterium ADurb.Bin416]|nr:MAG: hypothetical protein BWY72_00028 [Bacteroidetes bacterium ADurb.Bin416]
MVLNSSVTASLFCKMLNTWRLLAVESSLDLVIRGSTTSLRALALAVVVKMRLCVINEAAMFDNIELR